MVQIKQKRGIGVENTSPRSFSGGCICTLSSTCTIRLNTHVYNIYACVYMIDWCCFYYFVKNSLIALLEALCTRKVYACVYMSIYTTFHMKDTPRTRDMWLTHVTRTCDMWHVSESFLICQCSAVYSRVVPLCFFSDTWHVHMSRNLGVSSVTCHESSA